MKKQGLIFYIIFAVIFGFSAAFANSQNDKDDFQYTNLDFWNKFNDDILVGNLAKVYANNQDLKAAVLKVNQAQRVVKMSFANELPHIGFEGYAGQVFNSSDQVFGNITIPDYTESHFLLPLTMNYEIDIWGENRLKTKSKKKQFEIIQQDEKAAYILISSVFASDYYNLVGIDKLIEYQNELINLQKNVLSSYKTRYKFGTATISDVESAQKKLTLFEEELEKLKEKQDVLKNQISVLTADRSFENVSRISFENLNVNFTTPEAIDFKVLDKRPDRIKSELDLEKIGIDVKIARRDMLPKFIITGNLGFNLYNLSSSHKFLADIGVVPVWDVFTGGKKVQMLKLKKDTYNIAIEHYEKTILKAIQETNDALYDLKTAGKLDNIINDRLKTDKKLFLDTKIRQQAGTADNLDILVQKQTLTQAQKTAVTTKINKIVSAINLYQALGGVDFTQKTNL